MQSLKVLITGRRSAHRGLSAQPHYAHYDHSEDQVLVDGRASSRAAILNRPSALNALTTSMVARLKRLYESWEESPDIGFVLMKGSDRAFCSGGDAVALYHLLNEGFHPDAGASFYLSRLPGYLGEYLALTGDKLNGVEMIACGLATHYALNARLSMLEERLGKLVTDDGSESEAAESYDEWYKTTLKKLREASPLSLIVTLRSIREGRYETPDQCLAREYRISLGAVSQQVSKDFSEGVRARLVDKDFAPKWDPPSLGEVTEEMVDFYFCTLEESESELKLPTALREPSI
ncbi:hypothetical protein CRG98_045623 [Punica granatum]|uniref:3-hydroxyisobutyryl-CoA hydrolase n=1 Tax=Punica granatum TaxID=22663 RepID=A0A2I0HQL1_PUNGR|nr:hypothetical protein CRG98_045623 [Punica granatum]